MTKDQSLAILTALRKARDYADHMSTHVGLIHFGSKGKTYSDREVQNGINNLRQMAERIPNVTEEEKDNDDR